MCQILRNIVSTAMTLPFAYFRSAIEYFHYHQTGWRRVDVRVPPPDAGRISRDQLTKLFVTNTNYTNILEDDIDAATALGRVFC